MPAKEKVKPRLVDERLVAALSHETRAHALTVFTERPASTKEIAAELKKSVSSVWYHVDKLLELGCIELVRSEKRRGAMEHFYRATVRHFLDTKTWESLPGRNRLTITMSILRSIAGDVDDAVGANTVGSRDNHLSRTLLMLDAEGWKESNALLDQTLEALLLIREKSAARIADSDERPIRATVSMMEFELPSRAGS
ncbi:MAG TPA: winged helix-turn-helix domain-containing protein [Solirubrobacterales bacterium]|nr:winged helix-turn-helix domain-containing protein [Solirubrobacterales bacterium]